MIDPNLDDYWTKQHLTKFGYDGLTCWSTGVSLSVYFTVPELRERDWFSMGYGQGDLLMISPKYPREKVRHDPDNVFNDHLANSNLLPHAQIKEYKLTEAIVSRVGLVFDSKGSHHVGKLNEIDFELYFHDNCRAWLKPVNEITLRGIVSVLLQQHSFFLRRNVNWEIVIEEFLTFLKESKEISIQSFPEQLRVVVSELRQDSLWRKWFTRQPKPRVLEIYCNDDVASIISH